MSLTERLETIHFAVDETPHIVVDGEKCDHCADHPCLNFCPSQCFTPNRDGGIDYYYVGCVECGTCLLACGGEAVRWSYPQGEHGIQYRF